MSTESKLINRIMRLLKLKLLKLYKHYIKKKNLTFFLLHIPIPVCKVYVEMSTDITQLA